MSLKKFAKSGGRLKLFDCFSNNCMVANADKYHLLISALEEVSVKIENEVNKTSLQKYIF